MVRERGTGRRPQSEVVVVRHQTPGVDDEAVPLLGFPDHADEAVSLIGIGEDLLATGEAVVDVVEATLEQLSVRSGHRWSPSRPVYPKIVGIV